MIGIVGAMTPEIESLKNDIEGYKQTSIGGSLFYTGRLGNTDVVVAHSGIGKVNVAICTTILIETFNVDAIINTGIAGGFYPLKTRDVVLSTKIGFHDVDATEFGYAKGQIPGMPRFFSPNIEFLCKIKLELQKLKIDYKDAILLTGDQFISSKNKIDLASTENTICEMEGAALAQVCYRYNIPFVSIRYISDIIGHESQIDDYNSFEEEMSNNSAKICLAILKNMS